MLVKKKNLKTELWDASTLELGEMKRKEQGDGRKTRSVWSPEIHLRNVVKEEHTQLCAVLCSLLLLCQEEH